MINLPTGIIYKITDLETLSVTIFNSTNEASKVLGYKSYITVSQYCRENKTVKSKKFEFIEKEEL